MIRSALLLRVAGIVLGFSVGVAVAAGAEPFSSLPKAVESFDVGTLHVDKFGSGEQALILIPGLACGSWVWSDTIPRFSAAHTVYVITLPGFDGRAVTDEKPLFTAFARDFWTMLAAHQIEKPAVIGHSLGGTLAIALAEEHPERLAGIVAVDGLPVFPQVASATAAQREGMAGQVKSMYGALSKEEVFAAQKNYMSSVGTNKPELVEPAARLEARSDPKAIAAWTGEDLMTDLRPNLGKITIPFLEIMPYDSGQKPAVYTQEQTLAFYKSLIAGAAKGSVVAVSPARHFVMWDQPEAFHKVITEFLSGIHR